MAEAIRAAGHEAELLGDNFRVDAPDVDWLPVVGQRGWVLLTRDREVARNPLELAAIRNSGVRAFVLTAANDLKATDLIELVRKHLKRIAGRARGNAGPFISKVTQAGVDWLDGHRPPGRRERKRRQPPKP